MSENIKPIIFERTFKAPANLVFEVWTDADHIKNWMCPQKGFQIEFLSADIREGGSSLHKMSAPNGFEMYLLTKFDLLSKPTKIVFRQYNSNQEGEIVPNQMMPNAPKEMQGTVTLVEQGSRTKMTLAWVPVDPTSEQIAAFEATREQQGMGWNGGFDLLTEYIHQLV